MNTVALWIGWAAMVLGGIAVVCVCLYLAVDGIWRVWRSTRGFFNIVDAFDALREKQDRERKAIAGVKERT